MLKHGWWSLSVALLLASAAPAAAQAGATVGEKLQVQSGGTWYAATVLEIKDGQYKIRYDGWGSGWDEWVTPARMQRANGSAVGTPAAPKAPTQPPTAPTPSGGGLEVEWRTNAASPASPAAPPPPAPAPTPPSGGGLGVEWRTITPPAPTTPPKPVAPPAPVSPPPPVTPPAPVNPPRPTTTCTKAKDAPRPVAPDPSASDYAGLSPADISWFRSGFSAGFYAGWEQLRTGTPAQRPTYGAGQGTSNAYNTGWLRGFARAQQAWQQLSTQLARECAATSTPGSDGTTPGAGSGTTPVPANPLVGVWKYEAVAYFSSGGTVSEAQAIGGSLAFDAGGTFKQELLIGTFVNSLNGPYRIEGDKIVRSYRWGSREETETLGFYISGDLLTLTGPQARYTLRRIARP